MQRKVTLKMVQEAMEQLKAEGEKITCGKLLNITQGSKTTVHRLWREAEELETRKNGAPNDQISKMLCDAILAEIGDCVQTATSSLREELDRANAGEKGVLDTLAKVEEEAEELITELNCLQGKLSQEQQTAEKERATAAERSRAFAENISDLKEERNNLD